MKAFLVTVNGQRVALAGIGDDGVMGVSVQWKGGAGLEGVALPNRLWMNLGGLNSTTREHVHWDFPEIAVGDEVTIKIVEAESVDPELTRRVASDRKE